MPKTTFAEVVVVFCWSCTTVLVVFTQLRDTHISTVVHLGENAPNRSLYFLMSVQATETPEHDMHWEYAVPITTIHLLSCLAILPWCFSWYGVVAAALGTIVFGTFGINLGYHRLLSHRSLSVPPWFERILSGLFIWVVFVSRFWEISQALVLHASNSIQKYIFLVKLTKSVQKISPSERSLKWKQDLLI